MEGFAPTVHLTMSISKQDTAPNSARSTNGSDARRLLDRWVPNNGRSSPIAPLHFLNAMQSSAACVGVAFHTSQHTRGLTKSYDHMVLPSGKTPTDIQKDGRASIDILAIIRVAIRIYSRVVIEVRTVLLGVMQQTLTQTPIYFFPF